MREPCAERESALTRAIRSQAISLSTQGLPVERWRTLYDVPLSTSFAKVTDGSRRSSSYSRRR